MVQEVPIVIVAAT